MEPVAKDTPVEGAVAVPGRVRFDQLRERTDELELLISGLAMVALYSAPGWLIERYESLYPLLPFWMLSATAMALPMTVLACYVMAGLFALHLGLRACWVGLIGLKAAFPDGIRWTRAVGVGPLSRERLQSGLPGPDASIERADRRASALFAVITLSGLVLFWLGLLATAVFMAGAWVGNRSGDTNGAINIAVGWMVNILLGGVIGSWLLDAVLASRFPVLQRQRWFRWLARGFALVVTLFFPPRLTGVLRLTLQTNTRPWLFLVLFVSSIVILPLLALRQFQASFGFDRFGTHALLHARDTADGHRSVHYESERVERDRARVVPMIPSAVVDSAWLPLFLPYLPIRDDPVVLQRCPSRERDEGGFLRVTGVDDATVSARARSTAECLSQLWEVRLNGSVVALVAATPAERADLGFRGLSGYVDLRNQAPGPQRLEVIYRPQPEREQHPVDEAISGRVRYSIPFLWSPEWAGAPP